MEIKKEEIYLDLSKCSESEIKKIHFILRNKDENIHTATARDLINGMVTHCYWFLFFDGNAWNQNETPLSGRTELTYPEFIKLFEGVEGENNGWISAETKPNKFQDVILYREDAGVFMGYYGNLAETLSEMAIEQYYNEGVSEETMWKEQFFYFGIEGNGVLELDTEPTDWMPLPEPPKF